MDKYKSFLIKNHDARTPTWFWNGEKPLFITKELITELESYSDSNHTNCRVCIHTNPQELSHVMLIVEREGMNIPPHFHREKSDFVFILSGEMEFFTFPNANREFQLTNLLINNGYKAPAGQIHAVGIKSSRCTYIETSTGPFDKNTDAIFPEWADEWHKRYTNGSMSFIV